MYTLYYLPDACSLATLTVLLELDQQVTLINKTGINNFREINPVGSVPVLVDGEKTLVEGAAILLQLLQQKPNQLFPQDEDAQQQATQNIMFANATMHPAYGRLFFIAQNLPEGDARNAAFSAAAGAINQLWQFVETQLQDKNFLGGDLVSAADIMLTVYSRWGEHFPVEIETGPRTVAMLTSVLGRPTFQRALTMEAEG
ncbi:glutathione S-transferase [Endozoicomonas sp. OPT23]|uniref:glutathione S-transferase family protein n=1 Tax=Endozoicomonas sp. OPT23 TaxID=2072845 RepID=UPI00129B35CA|nr:glutathione S-transferase family protein [Endozoicomonas sp. OPT23]MRI32024.1 glutathione S-transferase [Endozoicomonas sp. OPT23]